MTRDTLLKFMITSGTFCVGVALMWWSNLQLPLEELYAPLGVMGTLAPAAIFYHRKQTPQFVSTLVAVIFLMVYLSCFTLLMYGGVALNRPLIDHLLVDCDAAFSVSLPVIVQWAQQHPEMATPLEWVYHSVILQTLLLVLFLGMQGDQRPLERFVFQFLVSLTVTAAIFCLAPAEGPFAAYGYEPTAQQASYLNHFHGFRNGAMQVVSLKQAEGLVTFPSFHTTWAILIAAAFWHRKRIFWPIMILNCCVLIATLTTGWHYFTDVMGGVFLSVVVIWLSFKLDNWSQQLCRL